MEKWKSWGNIMEMTPNDIATHIINDNLTHQELRSFIAYIINAVSDAQRTIDNNTAHKILVAEMMDNQDVFKRLKDR
jgi:hypothetical protein